MIAEVVPEPVPQREISGVAETDERVVRQEPEPAHQQRIGEPRNAEDEQLGGAESALSLLAVAVAKARAGMIREGHSRELLWRGRVTFAWWAATILELISQTPRSPATRLRPDLCVAKSRRRHGYGCNFAP